MRARRTLLVCGFHCDASTACCCGCTCCVNNKHKPPVIPFSYRETSTIRCHVLYPVEKRIHLFALSLSRYVGSPPKPIIIMKTFLSYPVPLKHPYHDVFHSHNIHKISHGTVRSNIYDLGVIAYSSTLDPTVPLRFNFAVSPRPLRNTKSSHRPARMTRNIESSAIPRLPIQIVKVECVPPLSHTADFVFKPSDQFQRRSFRFNR